MESESKKVALIGSGSWATAIAKILLQNIDSLKWYIREPEIISHMLQHQHNPLYLSAIQFDISKLELYDNINEIIEDSDIIIFCIPSKFVKGLSSNITASFAGKQVVTAIKGIVPDENLIISEYLKQRFGIADDSMAVFSGPCHAEEVALERLSYLTVGSKNQVFAKDFAQMVQSHFIRVCVSEDVEGIEYSAVMKNIMALAAGICHGLGYGDNFTSVLISNAIQEMNRFVATVNPLQRDINDSVYLGDLLVTAYSQFSRNRTFGAMIGKGYSVKSAELEMTMIAEGYYATYSIKHINDNYGVDMPITNAVYNILYERISPTLEFKVLSESLR
jgi:glycerol-3-phosphate dehydrogenase (NAD(P)+)